MKEPTTTSRKDLIQLALPAIGTSILLSVVCVLSIWLLNRLQSDRQRQLAKDVASLEAALKIQLSLRHVRFHALIYIVDPTEARKAVLDHDHEQLEEAMDMAIAAVDEEQEMELIDRVRAGYAAYRSEIARVTAPLKPGPDGKDLIAWADAHPMRPLLDFCEKLVEMNRDSLNATTAANESLTDRIRIMLVLIGIFGPLSGLCSGVGIAWIWARRWNLQQRELARAEQMAAVGHLAAGVAHEIRNPLTGMKWLIQAAVRSGKPADLTTEELTMILEDIGRAERTVQGLLDYAKHDEVKPASVTTQSFPALGSIHKVIQREKSRAETKGVKIVVEASAADDQVVADPDRFTSMVSNLVINAVEASPVGSVVRIALKHETPGKLQIQVEDRGAGISPAMQQQLFHPFSTDKTNGTGLGLYLARRFARENGGDLEGTNAPHGGGCFTITLPSERRE